MKLFNSKDLEWLAWNWRLLKNMEQFDSRRQMIYGHFNHDIGLLPSPEQILFGLILAQVSYFTHLEKKDTDYRYMLK